MKRVMVDGEAHDFPDDATEAEISAALNATKAAEPSKRARTWTDTAVDALPTVGGMVGGIGGGLAGGGVGSVPLAVGGATAGGAVGEAARLAINRARGIETPQGATDIAKDIGTQGVIQGGSELLGQGLVLGAVKAAPKLMGGALHLTDKLAREFPDLSETMIHHALTVTQGGMTKARALLKEATDSARAALTSAHAAGATVPATAATNGLTKTLGQVLNSADIEGGLATLASVERNALAGRAGDLTPMEADALKRSLQTQSKSLYRAVAMGEGRPNVTIKAQALADMAQSLNESLGQITTQAGAPGYRASNATAQDLIGATRGIRQGMKSASSPFVAAARPGVGATLGALGGYEEGGLKGATVGATIGAMASHAATSPAGMSRLAVTLSRPGIQQVLRGAPRLTAAIAQYLASGDTVNRVTPEPGTVIDPDTGQPMAPERTAMR